MSVWQCKLGGKKNLMGKHALFMVSISVENKGKWTHASYEVDVLKVDAKLS